MGSDAFVPPGTEKYKRYTAAGRPGAEEEATPESFEEELLREMGRELGSRGGDFEGSEGDDTELPESPNFGAGQRQQQRRGAEGGGKQRGGAGGGGKGGDPFGGASRAR